MFPPPNEAARYRGSMTEELQYQHFAPLITLFNAHKMGNILSKNSSLTKCLVSLEDKITKQEKLVLDLQNTRSRVSFNSAVLIFASIPCIFSYAYLANNYMLALLSVVLILFRYLVLRLYTYRIQNGIKSLGKLRTKQREQIEALKKEESFLMTKKVIEKYELDNQKKAFFSKIRQKPKGVVDKVTDLVLGEDPNRMYALICTSCHYHNGMVHPTEYEMTKFYCYNCNTMNIREAKGGKVDG